MNYEEIRFINGTVHTSSGYLLDHTDSDTIVGYINSVKYKSVVDHFIYSAVFKRSIADVSISNTSFDDYIISSVVECRFYKKYPVKWLCRKCRCYIW